MKSTYVSIALVFLGIMFAVPVVGAEPATNSSQQLVRSVQPFLDMLAGRSERFLLTGKVKANIDGRPHTLDVTLRRWGAERFDLELTHDEYAVAIRRREHGTALALPKHKTVFLGKGSVHSVDNIRPADVVGRVLGDGTKLAGYFNLLKTVRPESIGLVLNAIGGVNFDAKTETWLLGDVRVKVPQPQQLVVGNDEFQVDLKLSKSAAANFKDFDSWPEYEVTNLPRQQIELHLCRGVRRTCEVLLPSAKLTNPQQEPRQHPHGKLEWVEGQRVVTVWGTPEQIGLAHAELLKVEATRCIDSVLYAFGTVQTIRTGRWFRKDLEAAYARLSPHIPERHKRETVALARGLGIEPDLANTLNVFPELFHCSGFAVFGKATSDGKLYHGRVLDYMTTIGLQDAATVFIVRPKDHLPFANIGYGGFIGSVSGMNVAQVSLGEMGGRGEGKWDGVPMATLMRRALEECRTLDEVIDLWKRSPRTCEYYYVFADGKDNKAVGVAATPDSIEFIFPGQSHPRLGEGIADTVLLSAGDRLSRLRERVQAKYGGIDASTAQWLMSRPVAMNSNLHNVLFVPADGVFYFANATHDGPGADQPYVKIDLQKYLKRIAEPGQDE